MTVEYLVTDQRYTSDKMGDLADQFRPYPGKAVPLPDDQTSIVYAKITDWAGNVTYLSTDDLTVDATAPEISSDVAENQIYCQDGLRIAFRDDHLKSVTLNGTEMTYSRRGRLVCPPPQRRLRLSGGTADPDRHRRGRQRHHRSLPVVRRSQL